MHSPPSAAWRGQESENLSHRALHSGPGALVKQCCLGALFKPPATSACTLRDWLTHAAVGLRLGLVTALRLVCTVPCAREPQALTDAPT